MTAAVFASALLQAFTMNAFLEPVGLLPSGFTGIASLLSKILGSAGIHFSTSLGMVLLNIPVAIFCYQHIGKKFVLFSMLQVLLSSIFLQIIKFDPLFNDVLLNICFGGFIYGLAISIALKGNASTAGMDFIALYVSNRIGKSIWQYVFVFNCCLLCIFGALFGWEHAGYSILFQFVSTKTISAFHHRYERVTLQITTTKAEEVIRAYVTNFRHGISYVEAVGGYSHKKMHLLHTVVSSYEVPEIVALMRQQDPHIIVNMIKTENFYGGFYQAPID